MNTYGPFSSGVAAGTAGVATNNKDTPVKFSGGIGAVVVQYKDSPPATTDVVIKTKGAAPAEPSVTILSLANQNVDGRWYPTVLQHGTDGVATTIRWPIFVDDFINISIAQANAGDSVDVWILADD